MIGIENYIIDYERVNELTVHKNDAPDSGYAGLYVMGARSCVKKYLKNWEEQMLRRDYSKSKKEFTPEMKHMFNTLLYNGVIINVKEKFRENAIREILKEDG